MEVHRAGTRPCVGGSSNGEEGFVRLAGFQQSGEHSIWPGRSTKTSRVGQNLIKVLLLRKGIALTQLSEQVGLV